MTTRKRGGIEHILLVRLDAVGDFILTTPAIRAVRENYPNAHITLVVRNHVYSLAELCPYVNEVIGFDVNFFNGNFVFNNGVLEILDTLKEFSKKFFGKNTTDWEFVLLSQPVR